MKEYRCYIRTVLLSVLAALVIDAVINFEDYKEGWLAGLKKETTTEENLVNKPRLPIKIGKATGMIFSVLVK